MTNDNFLKCSISDAKNISLGDVVAYSASGEPLSREHFMDRIYNAIKQCEQGQSSSHEDFMKELKIDF